MTFRVLQTDAVNGKRWAFDTETRVWVPDGSPLEHPFADRAQAEALARSVADLPRMLTTVESVLGGETIAYTL